MNANATSSRLTIISSLLLLALLAGACSTQAPAAETLQPVEVQSVIVEVGVGSPIPVNVMVAGQWPDLCAQLAEVNQTAQGGRIEIEILAAPADPDCPPDFVGLAFGMAVPLNSVALQPGVYQVTVNGVATEFEWGQ